MTRRDEQLHALRAWANPRGIRTLDARRCRTCRQLVLRGLNADRAAFEVDLDPTPLSVAGEVLALLAGRVTHTVRRRNGHLEATRRDRFTITRFAPGQGVWDVYPAHACHADPLPGIPTALDPTTRTKESTSDQPPF